MKFVSCWRFRFSWWSTSWLNRRRPVASWVWAQRWSKRIYIKSASSLQVWRVVTDHWSKLVLIAEELGTPSLVHMSTSISTNIPLLCCLLLFQIHIHFTCSTRPIGESVHMWSWEFSFSVLGNRGRPKRKTMTLDKAVYKYSETEERWKRKYVL